MLAGDPAAGIARWFTEGAPSGLATDIAELEGLLPESQLELDTDDFNNLHTDLDLFLNYKGIEQDHEVAFLLATYVDAGY